MEYMSERKEIVDTCHLMCELGFFIGTWGNISIRVGDHILLTPSKVDYDLMRPEDIVVIDLDGNRVCGEKNPTSEKEVHRLVYLAKNDVFGIIHTHTTNAMALSATGLKQVPCLVEETSQLIGGDIPLTSEYVPAAEHHRLGEVTAEAIGDKMAVIMRNHGAVACGKNLKEAVLTAKVIEKSCEIYIKGKSCGIYQSPIPQKYIDSEHYRYRFTYGKEKT